MFYVFLRVQFTVNNLWRQMVIEHKLSFLQKKTDSKTEVFKRRF